MASHGLGRLAGPDRDHRRDVHPGAVRGSSRNSERSGVSEGIHVSDLRAYFGAHEALHGINMEIAPRTTTAIIGPSGCGKSTFVRCINRMHETVPGARV